MSRDIHDYTVQYQSLPFEAIQAGFRRRRVLAEIARVQPRHLLEVGCGLAPLFTDLPDTAVTVIEPAPAFAEHARQLAGGRTDVRVMEGYLESVAPPGDKVDMIILSSLLHEVEDPQALLAAVRRHCDGDTLVHVNVPNALSLHRLLAVAMGLMDAPGAISATQRTMQQRATYDTTSLAAELESAGFEVVARGSLFIKPFTHGQMQQLVDSGFMTDAMLEGLDKLVEQLPEQGSEIYINARLRHG
ncbi:class I SAM-dependent methyltransferase [Chitinimonas arctica]|uniref:Class I SAM-dependent methyltransferase n=1 Tax=Chitinimonas arctica TaxID=2594795 RepID=A0A516SDN2_9NEIS|nr:class I SAM-dependent methyltransferase [Chitinimonas arctica]QDQ26267.1 class I SAM-dependent methyltransferase [Chitinimonas arctica]